MTTTPHPTSKAFTLSENLLKAYQTNKPIDRDISIESHYRNAWDTYIENEYRITKHKDKSKTLSDLEIFCRGFTDAESRTKVLDYEQKCKQCEAKDEACQNDYQNFVNSSYAEQLHEYRELIEELLKLEKCLKYLKDKEGKINTDTLKEKVDANILQQVEGQVKELNQLIKDKKAFESTEDKQLVKELSEVWNYVLKKQKLDTLKNAIQRIEKGFERQMDKCNNETRIEVIVNSFFGTFERQHTSVLIGQTLLRIKEMPHLCYYYNGVRFIYLNNWNHQDQPHELLQFMVSDKVLKFLDIEAKYTHSKTFISNLRIAVNKRFKSVSWYEQIKKATPRINFLDQCYNLKTGQFEAHSPTHFCRAVYPITTDYLTQHLPSTSEAMLSELKQIPAWYRYYTTSFVTQSRNPKTGNIEDDIRDPLDLWLQIVYSTTGLKNESNYQDFILAAKGKRGKSTKALQIQEMLGSDLHSLDASFEARNSKEERERGNELQSMQGYVLLTDDDISKKKTRGDATKRLTRRNEVRLRSNYSQGRPLWSSSQYVIDLSNNVLPIINAGDEIPQRIRTYFLQEVKELDPALNDKLRKEQRAMLLWGARIVMGFLTNLSDTIRPTLLYCNNPRPIENTRELLLGADYIRSFVEHLQLRYGQRGEQRLSKDYLFDLYKKHLSLEGASVKGQTKTAFLQALDNLFSQSILGKVSKDGTARKWLTKESPNQQTTNAVNLVIEGSGKDYEKELNTPKIAGGMFSAN